MKKKRLFLTWTLILALLLTACGASSKGEAAPSEPMYNESFDQAATEECLPEAETPMEQPVPDPGFGTLDVQPEESVEPQEVQTYADKIIYSGYVVMETTEFDQTLQALDEMVKSYGGFVQDSSVDGYARRYDDGTTVVTDRWANYVLRIPAVKFDHFMTQAGEIGNVTSSSRSAQNVTSQYTDYEARLSSLRTQETRLLEMLEQSGTLEDLIALEARLSEVRYEIESIERNLRDLDQRLSYSTVTLEIQEVEVVTRQVGVQRTFGQKVADAFGDSWDSFVWELQNFTLGLIYALPALILLAIVVTLVVLVVRKVRRRGRKTRAPKAEPDQEQPEEPKKP